MSLEQQISKGIMEAMKAKDEVRKNTISLARAAIKQFEVDNRGTELDDGGVIAILSKQVKMRKDALSDFEKAGRTDLADAYRAEMEVLTAYLPQQLSADEIAKIVKETAEAMGIDGGKQNMGKLMGAVMGKVKGVADGGEVKKAVEAFLS